MWHNEFETEPIHTNSLYFYEPLDTDAPEMAHPYCCYLRTTIFYEGTPGMSEMLDRVESQWNLLGQRWTDEDIGFSALAAFVEHESQVYELGGAQVIWRNGGWQKRWRGRRVAEDDRRLVVMRSEGLDG